MGLLLSPDAVSVGSKRSVSNVQLHTSASDSKKTELHHSTVRTLLLCSYCFQPGTGMASTNAQPEKRAATVVDTWRTRAAFVFASLLLFSPLNLPAAQADSSGPANTNSAVAAPAQYIQTSSMPTGLAPAQTVPVNVQTAQSAAPSPKILTGKAESRRPSFPIGSKFSRTIQTVTGVNFATQIVTNVIAARVVEKKLGGHCKVKVRIYSFTDLLAGKLKTFSVQGNGCTFKDIPLGQIIVSSDAPVWYDWRKRNGKVGGLNGATNLKVVGELRQDDVCKALATEALARSLRGLKLDLPGLGEQQLQILQPKVALNDRRIQIDALLITKGASPDTGVNLTISAVPVLEGSKIMLTETRVSCPDILDPENFAVFTQDLFNPIVDFGKYDRTDHAFRLAKFVVEGGKVFGSGNLLLVPRSHLAGTTPSSAQPVK